MTTSDDSINALRSHAAGRRAGNPFGGLRIAITGGTSGLGLALVRELLHRGASVAFVARTRSVVERVAAEHPGAHGIVGDVATKQDIHPIAMQILGALGGLDVLINNASDLGPVPLALLADTDCEDFERALATNVLGPFRLTKALLGSLAASARDRIDLAHQPTKGAALDIPTEPLAGCQYLLARSARLGPLCEPQRAQDSRNELHSGPMVLDPGERPLDGSSGQPGAAVVNISSDAAMNPYPRWGAYGASKAALHQLSRVWNEELTAEGVAVLSLDPGDMDTPLHAAAVPDADRSRLKRPEMAATELADAIGGALSQRVALADLNAPEIRE